MAEKFLIVDDNRFFGDLCQEIIRKKYNCSRIDYAPNGIEALEKVRLLDYSAIVSDIDMPGMDGIVFYEELKEEFPLFSKKVGFMSGKLNEFHTTFFAREGRPYLSKPFTYEQLIGMIDQILEENGNTGKHKFQM